MTRLAVAGTKGSLAWQAAQRFAGASSLHACPDMATLLDIFTRGEAEFGLFPVYNTREGERKQHFRFFDRISTGYWIDNVVLYSQISLGVFDETHGLAGVRTIAGTRETLSQCEEYIDTCLSAAREVRVHDVGAFVDGLQTQEREGLALQSSRRSTDRICHAAPRTVGAGRDVYRAFSHLEYHAYAAAQTHAHRGRGMAADEI